ncbi:MAG TPA: DUF4200 domain-containing protein [Candidatus Thermoplasmatota archaeon]|nr:DUF4200 domain-containing protein [Candidatus Thermoplasmatota archaeon]
MTLRRLVPLAILALALLAPTLPAQGATGAPVGAHTASVGNATLSYWVGPNATQVDEELSLGEQGQIWFWLSANETRAVAYLNVTSSNATLDIPNGSVVLDASGNGTRVPANVSFRTTIADAGVVHQAYAFTGQVYREENGTLVLLGPISGSGTFTVDVGALVPVPTAPAPGIPSAYLWGGAALLLVGAIVVGVSVRQRNIRRRMNDNRKRSVVMRELELEKKLEKAKDPEQVQEIKQEIRAQESVREKRRELQILEAKRADAQKTLDLLKKRHESGGLTKLQYDNMAAKKQADLARIDAEIAQMEQEDSSGGAAA